MATTKTTYTGNGSNRLFPFSFPYLFPGDIKVQLNGVNTTAYTFANATTVEMTTAPAAGVVVTVYRDTGSDSLVAEFYPGSAIRAQDLNDDYSQLLYVVQEAETLAAETDLKSTAAQTAANTATTQANIATTSANAATSTANVAISQSTAAVNTANSSVSVASSAVITANSAVNISNAKGDAAIASAATANVKSDQAVAIVSAVVPYTLLSNVAGIPSAPANDTFVEIGNSTGIESFSPVVGIPSGFVGDSGLTVRLRYTTAGATWNWLNYYANNSESRYLKLAGGTLTGHVTLVGAPTNSLHPVSKSYADTALNLKLDISTATSTYQVKDGLNKDYSSVAQAYFFSSF
jgi:hypothetical protein